jgi:elongation factor P
MDNNTYEQYELTEEQVGEAKNFLIDNMTVEALFFGTKPIGLEVPNFVELEITETDPAVKGDTVTGATKPATLSTGHVLNIPLFVNEGEWIVVDTRTGDYVERVKK